MTVKQISVFLENKKIVWDEPFWKKDWQKFLKELVVSHLGVSAEIILIGSFKHEIKNRAALAKFKPARCVGRLPIETVLIPCLSAKHGTSTHKLPGRFEIKPLFITFPLK